MENNFENVLGISPKYHSYSGDEVYAPSNSQVSFSAGPTYGNGGEAQPITPYEMNQILVNANQSNEAITHLVEKVNILTEKVNLYDKVFAAMFGKEEERKQFIDYLKQNGGGTDNFQIVKIMDAFNKLRSIERKQVENVNG